MATDIPTSNNLSGKPQHEKTNSSRDRKQAYTYNFSICDVLCY